MHARHRVCDTRTWPAGAAQAAADSEPDAGEDALVRALRKAIESGDTNLVLLVLFHIYCIRPLQVSSAQCSQSCFKSAASGHCR